METVHSSQTRLNSARLQESLTSLRRLLLQHGISTNNAAQVSLQRFQEESLERQEFIIANISKYLGILGHEAEVERPRSERRELEVARLKKALKEFGLKNIDDDVFHLINEDDVVEIYDFNGVQLYRNLAFCKSSSYSLLDLAVNSWEELYAKPTAVTNALKDIFGLMQSADKTMAYNLGKFIQRERFIYAKTRRTFLVEPKFISPLVTASNGQRFGAISTYGSSLFHEGEGDERLEIL